MFYIAARKVGKIEVEKAIREPFDAAFQDAIAVNYGGVAADYSFYTLADNHTDAVRIRNGDEYSLIWTGTDITGLDFSAENAKRYIKVTASKSTILADNADSTVITIEVWKADGSGVDTAVNTTKDMPIRTPTGLKTVRVAVASGSSVRTFKTSTPGLWMIPGASRVSGLRVAQAVTVESVIDFANL